MDHDASKPRFYQSLMTGLFLGMVVTLLCLIFNYFFRGSTGFALSGIINIASLTFFTILLFLMLGVVYYQLLKALPKGELVFIVLMVLLTVVSVWRAEYAHRTSSAVENAAFRELLIGDIIIMGACAAFLLPYLYHHKKFQDTVI
ncbi:hypothetical protein [Flavisolibacter tropicus]|uniref:Uncharacterized protein n=1 Tax=Flavisolibacter tropicus TaxID=1492898 RepID=A0A172TWP8_9BACT|nr:hypothetical protein [Flavisolibacter tropicus]ANE51515.1 hypothetical protein SY85_14385 [Flavisolibacter tropicus]